MPDQSPPPEYAVDEATVIVAAQRMMSLVFEMAQPDRGDVFSWLDDHSHAIVRTVLSARHREESAAGLVAEIVHLLRLNDEAQTKYGGFADCEDNGGQPYQSQELSNVLARLRNALHSGSAGK